MISRQEAERQKIQRIVDQSKSRPDRNKLGQFSTPYVLAEDMMRYISTLYGSTPDSFLEPSIGTGVFYSAFREVFGSFPRMAEGYEIDKGYCEPSQELWKNTPISYKCANFLTSEKTHNYDLLVANPPYTRHHHIPTEDKELYQRLVSKQAGIKISGLAGLYCYFLILSTSWLSDGAYSVWLIPSEFMDVNYGEGVKLFLLNNVELVRIHRFLPEDVKFTDALVTSTIVVFRNNKPSRKSVLLSQGGSLNAPVTQKYIDFAKFRPSDKWTGLFSDDEAPVTSGKKLGDYFNISRGIATGDNSFFIIDECTAVKYGIPTSFLIPTVAPPRNMKASLITEDNLGGNANARFLFVCEEKEAEIRENCPTVWKYICQGVERKVNERYICQHREPWYYCKPNRNPLLVIPYMGRNTNGDCSFRFILNNTRCAVPNSYLMLFPKKEIEKLCEVKSTREQIWAVLNQIPKDVLIKGGRVYGGGLYKLEPSELMNIPIPELEKLLEPKKGKTLFVETDFR